MTLDEMMNIIVEKGIVGGAFLFLLYQFITKFSTSQERIVDGLTKMQEGQLKMSETMTDISETLADLDGRVQALEKKE